MREIKFRAITDNGQFIYGFLLPGGKISGKWYIVTNTNTYEIDIRTLGQYTGLKDKKGKEIFEGDIGHYPYDSEYDGNIPKGKNLWEVRWEGDMYMLYRGEGDHARYTGDGNCGDDPHYNKWEEFEIKGNIHQNPELLK